jgi:cardiolipin-specific phospholipase
LRLEFSSFTDRRARPAFCAAPRIMSLDGSTRDSLLLPDEERPAAHPLPDAKREAGGGGMSCCAAAALAVGAVPLAVLLAGWVALHRLMTLHSAVSAPVLALLAWVCGLALYVGTVASCGPDWQDALRSQVEEEYRGLRTGSLADLAAAFTLAVLGAGLAGRWALGTHYTRGRWLSPTLVPLAVVASFAALCLAKRTSAFDRPDGAARYGCGDWPLHVDGLQCALTALVALVAAWSSSCWLPITYDRQLVAERLLVDSRCGGSGAHNATRISHSRTSLLPYRQYVLAGLGTVEAGPTIKPQGKKKPFMAQEVDAPVIVLIHGLGSGSGHFCEQMVELSERHRLLCVEWRGCGRSDRARFTPTTHAETLEWFLPALDAWFEAAGLRGKPVTLVGHSMGAIIACEYCWRYPHQVGGLVLASPAGVPDEPPAEHMSGSGCNPWVVTQMLWSRGVTPFSILRLLGPFGRPAVRAVMHWRISDNHPGSHSRDALVEPIQSYLNEYMYQSLAAPASGEQAMTTLLHPDVRGVQPIGPKLIARASTHARRKQPIHLIYGGPEDWMDAKHGVPVVAALRASGVKAEHTVLEDAGHHIMLDNPDEFNAAVLRTAALVAATDDPSSRLMAASIEIMPSPAASPTVSPAAAAQTEW